MNLLKRCPLVSRYIVMISLYVFYCLTIQIIDKHHSQPLEEHGIKTSNKFSAANRDDSQPHGKNKDIIKITLQSVGKRKNIYTTKDYNMKLSPAKIENAPPVDKHKNIFPAKYGNMKVSATNKDKSQPVNTNKNITIKNSGYRFTFNQLQFEYVLHPHNVCNNENLFAIIYVHTSPSHYNRRMLIRQTWGNIFHFKIVKFKVVFVMGMVLHDKEAQRELEFESERYNDVVQFSFKDTYRNLTLKAISALKWINAHCNNTKFVVKTDDDIFINMFTLVRHLKSIAKINGNNTKGMIMCKLYEHSLVQRKGKWKVNKTEYKNDYYPPFCSGSAFVMTSDVSVQLYQLHQQIPFYWMDDVYLTGLVTAKAGNITMLQWTSMYVMEDKHIKRLFTGPKWMYYIFCHIHNLDSFQYVWDQIVWLNNKIENGINNHIA